jgi:catalase (peroxidase I)
MIMATVNLKSEPPRTAPDRPTVAIVATGAARGAEDKTMARIDIDKLSARGQQSYFCGCRPFAAAMAKMWAETRLAREVREALLRLDHEYDGEWHHYGARFVRLAFYRWERVAGDVAQVGADNALLTYTRKLYARDAAIRAQGGAL